MTEVTSRLASTHAAAAGDALHVGFTVRNVGTVASAAVPWALYLSTNNAISQGDVLLAQGTTSTGINGGAISNVTADATLPATLAPGSYYLGVVVNPTLSLAETNSLNDSAFDATPLAEEWTPA